MRLHTIPVLLPILAVTALGTSLLVQGESKERMIHKPLVHLGDSEVDWEGLPAMPHGVGTEFNLS